jgi:Protein of unknown function (DUF2905)
MQLYGKFLVLLGVVIAGVGLILMVFGQIPLIGKLPGDIRIRKENFELFIPLTSSIVISIIISIIFWVVSLFSKK